MNDQYSRQLFSPAFRHKDSWPSYSPVLTVCPSPGMGPTRGWGLSHVPEAGCSPEEMLEPQGTDLIATDRTEPSGGDFRKSAVGAPSPWRQVLEEMARVHDFQHRPPPSFPEVYPGSRGSQPPGGWGSRALAQSGGAPEPEQGTFLSPGEPVSEDGGGQGGALAASSTQQQAGSLLKTAFWMHCFILNVLFESLISCAGSSLLLRCPSSCLARASPGDGFTCCRARALGCRLSRCGAQAQLPPGMLGLPSPGVEPRVLYWQADSSPPRD